MSAEMHICIDLVRVHHAPAKRCLPGPNHVWKLFKEPVMSRIKLNLRQAIPDKLQTGRHIIAAMTNNPNFATPHPPLADVTTSLTTLDEAYKAHQIAKSDARAKANVADDAEIQFDSQFRKLAAYVESIADTDETIIASAGPARDLREKSASRHRT